MWHDPTTIALRVGQDSHLLVDLVKLHLFLCSLACIRLSDQLFLIVSNIRLPYSSLLIWKYFTASFSIQFIHCHPIMSSSTAKLYPPSKAASFTAFTNPLPTLLQTPSGLAILELQGTINLPQDSNGETLKDVEAGRLEFPDYTPDAIGTAWMKRVHLYIGQHQRLHGEVKKLPKAIAVVRKRQNRVLQSSAGSYTEQGDNLEVVEIVKYKLMFTTRPEPVGTAHAPAS
jgi:chromosome transmission fidelity protein 8